MDVIFVVSAVVSVVGAVLMVLGRNPVYALVFLLMSFCGAAGVFYSLNATFVAVSQILVYAGAIAVLFLFVLMFVDLGKKGEEQLPKRVDSLATYEPAAVSEAKIQKGKAFQFNYAAALVALAVLSVFVWAALALPEEGYGTFGAFPIAIPDSTPDAPKGAVLYFGSTESIGRALFFDFPLHYEVVGLVILVGVMGAVILGKRISDEQREDTARKAAIAKAAEEHPAMQTAGHH